MESAFLSRPFALRLTPALAARGFVALGGAIALWNAVAYPSGTGYDAHAHQTYTDWLLTHHGLPGDRSASWESYSPPLYYLVVAFPTWLGEHLHLSDPYKLAQLVSVPVVVGTLLLVAALARLLWPRRPWAAPAAAGFAALSPVLTRTAAMFHPEPLDLLLATLSAYLAVRMLERRSYGWRAALGLGVALGLAQMTRQFALYTLAAVAIAWAVAAWRRTDERRALLRAGAVALAAVVAIAGPWYGWRQQQGGNALFNRPTEKTSFWQRRPASFYLGTGLPTVFERPYRPNFENRAWPQTYTDLWGDWFGYFAWDRGAAPAPPAATTDWLVAQNAIGIVPTLLAIGGWLVLLAAAVRRRAGTLLLVGLVPLAGLAGYLYFAIAYPTPDGDVLKPTFMLSTLWGWALCFGWAAAEAGRRRPRLTALVLGALALADLPFVVYRGALGLF
jgi:4-amino-4-deoxy-L-arabinose transferase-like glycosyltransferase